MIKKIAHLADIHIRKSPNRHDEYREVFNNLYVELKKDNPDRIVIVGDLVHDFLDLQGEQLVLAGEFLNNLSIIAPVVITRGNHDIRKKALSRTDTIEAVIETLGNDKIMYLNESKLFDDENVSWAVWKHGEQNNNPWGKKFVKDRNRTYIDLYHDPLNGSKSPTGYEFKNKRYGDLKNFKGDYVFLGDIHMMQFLDKQKTVAYPSSLVAQDFSEGDNKFHGYLLWDIDKKTVEEREIDNEYSFKTISVNSFTDFDDLDIDVENPTKYMRVRVVWNVLPAIRNKDNIKKVTDFLNTKYSPVKIYHKNEFLEEDTIDVDNELDIEDLSNGDVQQEIFTTYLDKIGTEQDMIDSVLHLDKEISEMIEVENFTNILWSIIKFKGINFMSYKELDVDWRDDDGLYQITGLNTAGKTTIMELITYILYNKTPKTETRVKAGDSRYVNNKLDVKTCSGEMVIDVNGQYFGIKRETTIEYNKEGEIKGAPTQLSFYKLTTPDDDFSDEANITNLIEEDKNKTQVEIEKAIGSYDNFMRVVMTTSDTLNRVLSDDKSVFIDSLLYDSGLDIFDTKLNAFKEYKKDVMSKPRVTCNLENSQKKLEEIGVGMDAFVHGIAKEEENKGELVKKQKKGEEYLQEQYNELINIPSDILNFDLDSTTKQIGVLEEQKELLFEKTNTINKSISELKTVYDENKLNELTVLKDSIRQEEFDVKHEVTLREREIMNVEMVIDRLRTEINVNIKEGKRLKQEIIDLKNSKNCPTCGQLIVGEHQEHIKTQITERKDKMIGLADNIKKTENLIEVENGKIESLRETIEKKEKHIEELVVSHEKTLQEIGELTNDKNEVERRKQLEIELDVIPTKIENIDLNIEKLQKSINEYDKSLEDLKHNEEVNKVIIRAKERLETIKQEIAYCDSQISQHTISYNNLENESKTIVKLMEDFKAQERHDEVMKIYQKCVHRDGIPTQMLKNYAIPKINQALSDIMEYSQFDVWLDDDDLKLKLNYSGEEKQVIDAISGSGKERTFASVALKFALNEINAKSKPTILLLDEIMGKLTDESVDEFVSMLTSIKDKMKKVLIIEHNHTINYDYLIEVVKDDNGISNLTIS